MGESSMVSVPVEDDADEHGSDSGAVALRDATAKEPPMSTVGAGTPTVPTPTPVGYAYPTREAKWQAVALAVAQGTPVAQVAEQFGYTVPGMYKLLKADHMQARVAGVQDELLNRAAAITSRILMRADRLVDLELQIADPQPLADGTYPPGMDPTSKFSRESRHYLLDKVLATRSNVTVAPNQIDPDVRSTLVESRELLRKLNAMAALRTTNIQASPHVHDGAAAVPRALEPALGTNDG